MKLEIPGYVTCLMDELNANGYECYIVGGAIRSLLLGLPVHDYDLTTNALPQQMKEVFASHKTIDTGLKHGTLTVLYDHHPIEITTYRKDASYQDHRHPDAVEFTSAIEEDCARRDFTINAFCYNEKDGLLDFFQGRQDLADHILRCIGDPSRRFEEDALRILRAIRFAAQLHFQMEEKTKQAIFLQKQLLSYISMERIHEEFTGFLGADNISIYLDEYKKIFALFLPEIQLIHDWHACLTEIDAAGKDVNACMAILLQDAEDPDVILQRMKYANTDRRQILSYLRYRNVPLTDTVSLRKFMSTYAFSLSSYFQYRAAMNPSFPKEKMEALAAKIQIDHDCISLAQLALKGNDLTTLGYHGKAVSTVLQDLLNAVMEEKVPNQKEALLTYLKKEKN